MLARQYPKVMNSKDVEISSICMKHVGIVNGIEELKRTEGDRKRQQIASQKTEKQKTEKQITLIVNGTHVYTPLCFHSANAAAKRAHGSVFL